MRVPQASPLVSFVAILAALSLPLAVVFALTLIVLLGLLAIGRFAVSWTRRRPALA